MTQELTEYVPDEKFGGEHVLRARMATDFPYYAETNLKIATKSGDVIPLKLNRAQRHIHKFIEKQKKAKGYVRVIVLKARQQGCSTYTGGRFYWLTTKRKGVNGFVLSHSKDTTKKLFAIVRRYHNHCDEMFKQRTTAASATEFNFAGIDSTYTVGTAGSAEVGRGGTIHFFHGSEVGFWTNADMHFSGIMQSIPTGDTAKGSEVILESTANGMTGKFYDLTMEALAGKNDYEVIFTPWYWQEEYKQTPPMGWEVPDQDVDYQKVYDLSIEQMWWRQTTTSLLGSEWRFKQEYPCTIEEAFQTSGDESYIPPQLIMSSRSPKDYVLDGDFPRIGACDPAWKGDRAGIGFRIGNRFKEIIYYENKDPTELAEICKSYINEHNLDRMFVDVIGIGAGVYSNLKHDGFARIVTACNFSHAATDMNQDGTPKYLNHRAECWGRMREWMEEGPVEIPNLDELATDLGAPQYTYSNSRGVLQLESKDDMRKRGMKSPDGGDVLAMTFSSTVHPRLRNVGKPVKVIKDYDILNF